jgi:hypothetical protein
MVDRDGEGTMSLAKEAAADEDREGMVMHVESHHSARMMCAPGHVDGVGRHWRRTGEISEGEQGHERG